MKNMTTILILAFMCFNSTKLDTKIEANGSSELSPILEKFFNDKKQKQRARWADENDSDEDVAISSISMDINWKRDALLDFKAPIPVQGDGGKLLQGSLSSSSSKKGLITNEDDKSSLIEPQSPAQVIDKNHISKEEAEYSGHIESCGVEDENDVFEVNENTDQTENKEIKKSKRSNKKRQEQKAQEVLIKTEKQKEKENNIALEAALMERESIQVEQKENKKDFLIIESIADFDNKMRHIENEVQPDQIESVLEGILEDILSKPEYSVVKKYYVDREKPKNKNMMNFLLKKMDEFMVLLLKNRYALLKDSLFRLINSKYSPLDSDESRLGRLGDLMVPADLKFNFPEKSKLFEDTKKLSGIRKEQFAIYKREYAIIYGLLEEGRSELNSIIEDDQEENQKIYDEYESIKREVENYSRAHASIYELTKAYEKSIELKEKFIKALIKKMSSEIKDLLNSSEQNGILFKTMLETRPEYALLKKWNNKEKREDDVELEELTDVYHQMKWFLPQFKLRIKNSQVPIRFIDDQEAALNASVKVTDSEGNTVKRLSEEKKEQIRKDVKKIKQSVGSFLSLNGFSGRLADELDKLADQAGEETIRKIEADLERSTLEARESLAKIGTEIEIRKKN